MKLRITVEGRAYEVGVEVLPDTPVNGTHAGLRVPDSVLNAPNEPDEMPGDHICRSPIAGVVVSIPVTAGHRVKKGELLLTLDAMKMYNPIAATLDGIIESVEVSPGQAVKPGEVLFKLA